MSYKSDDESDDDNSIIDELSDTDDSTEEDEEVDEPSSVIESNEMYVNNYIQKKHPTVSTLLDPKDYIQNKMSPYEYAKIVSVRVEQISRGASPLIETLPNEPTVDIVLRELLLGLTPLVVIRKNDDNSYESHRITVEFISKLARIDINTRLAESQFVRIIL